MTGGTERPGLSFRLKLALSFVGVSGALLCASLYFLSRFSYEVVLEKVASDYEHTMMSTQHLLERRALDVNEGLELALSDPLFRSELARARNAGLDLGLGGGGGGLESSHRVFSSTSLPLFTKFQIFAILTSDGSLVYSRQQKDLHGESWAELAPVGIALSGRIGLSLVDTFETKPGPFLIATFPVRAEGDVLGVFLVGEPLAADLIPRIEASSGASVYIDTGGPAQFGLRGSLMRAAHPSLSTSVGKVGIEEVAGVRNLAARMPVKNPLTQEVVAHAILLKPLEGEMGSVRRGLELALVKILVLAVLASVLVAALLSKQVTAALTALRNGVRRVQEGDLNVQLEARTSDEFGQLTMAFNDMTAGLRQRELLKTSFEKYVASPVVEGIIRNEAAPEVKGERRVITCFFSDIEGFTSLSETEEPAKLLRDLNEYLGFFTERIKRNAGTVDKFVGDAVMAIWGFGEARATDAAHACEAALSVQERQAGRPEWITRIGINTGEAIVGNIGSQERLQYTAIGDMVNTAARLEALNKKFGTRILAADSTRQAGQGADILFRDLGEIVLRGKNKPVRVHEVFARASTATEAEKDFCEAFNQAMALFSRRDWDQAVHELKTCGRLRPGDKATSLYLSQALAFQAVPPAEGASISLQVE